MNISKLDLSNLVCPICKKEVIIQETQLQCLECNQIFSINENYIDFLKSDDYWGEISQTRINKLINDVKSFGSNKALFELVREFPKFTSFIFNHDRIDWIFHKVSFTNNHRFLDIGSGLGMIVFLASKMYKEVYSLENILERIIFQNEVIKNKKIENIFLFRADGLRLPFKDDYFDFISINGVLEWIGLNDIFKNPKYIQIQFLKEVRRVLKPNGNLYIGIENRVAPKYFRGAMDHSGYAYTSIMPRFLANLYMKVVKKPAQHYTTSSKTKTKLYNYSTYTYSYIGYQRLLKKAGYPIVEIYYTSPDYNAPELSFNLNTADFYLKYRRNSIKEFKKRLIVSLLSKAPLLFSKLLIGLRSPCYLIFSRKVKKDSNFVKDLLDKTNCKNLIKVSGRENLTGKVLFFIGDQKRIKFVAKIARFDDGDSKLKNEMQKIQEYNNIKVKKIVIQQKEVYLEPYINGRRFRKNEINNQKRAIDWLLKFQKQTDYKNHDQIFKDEHIKLNKYLLFLSENNIINNSTFKKLVKDLNKFYEIIEKIKLNICSEHGDFFLGNIILSKNRLYYIDFEFFKKRGNPIFDFCFFILCNIDDLKKDLENKGTCSKNMTKLIEYYIKFKNIPSDLIYYGFLYTIIRILYRSDPLIASYHKNYSKYKNLLKNWEEIDKNAFKCFRYQIDNV